MTTCAALSKDECGTCERLTLHDKGRCIHCGTLLPTIATVRPLPRHSSGGGRTIKSVKGGNKSRRNAGRELLRHANKHRSLYSSKDESAFGDAFAVLD